MPPFFPIVSVCALFEFNNVIKQSGYFFLRPLSVFFFLFFSFLFFFFVTGLMRTGNGNDQDRCINAYFARKNLESKFNSNNYELLQEMD